MFVCLLVGWVWLGPLFVFFFPFHTSSLLSLIQEGDGREDSRRTTAILTRDQESFHEVLTSFVCNLLSHGPNHEF